MKATGIVRRIDELGRVVIPREIRRNLGIKESDPLEIFVGEDNSVCFRKRSNDNILDSLQILANIIVDTCSDVQEGKALARALLEIAVHIENSKNF